MAKHKFLYSLLSWHSSTLHSSLHQYFSTLAKDEHTDLNLTTNESTHSRDVFAEFANTKLNLSATNTAHIFKGVPTLGNLKTRKNVEQFVDMLKRNGLTANQIALMMRSQHMLLTVSIERLLEPMIQYFKDFSIQGEDLSIVLMRKPIVLIISLQKGLIPTMVFLESVFQTK